jgi:hypothetical protein
MPLLQYVFSCMNLVQLSFPLEGQSKIALSTGMVSFFVKKFLHLRRQREKSKCEQLYTPGYNSRNLSRHTVFTCALCSCVLCTVLFSFSILLPCVLMLLLVLGDGRSTMWIWKCRHREVICLKWCLSHALDCLIGQWATWTFELNSFICSILLLTPNPGESGWPISELDPWVIVFYHSMYDTYSRV